MTSCTEKFISPEELKSTEFDLKLRSSPTDLSINDIKKIIKRYDFYDKDFNPQGKFENNFVKGIDDTLIDLRTGLMWYRLSLKPAKTDVTNWEVVPINPEEYSTRINTIKIAGFSDWRIPTIEELSSLLRRTAKYGLHIDHAFLQKDRHDLSFISSDKRSDSKNYWVVNFEKGIISSHSDTVFSGTIRIYKEAYIPIRVVRSLRY
jgi:hypothetical protein